MKKIDLQELSRNPDPVTAQIEKGESFALIYRGKVIAELRRSRTQVEGKGLEQLLAQAEALRTELKAWTQQTGATAEDSTETLRQLREDHAAAGLR